MSEKCALVTGGAGYIGSACVKALCDAGYKVVALDNLANGHAKYVDGRAVFVEGDVLDEAFLERVFLAHKPAVVIHMAAFKAVGESEAEPERYFRNNVVGISHVLTAAARHGVKHFIFPSSAAVYSHALKDRCSENDTIGSINVYGSTKIISEKLVTEFHRTQRIPVCTIFRYFNVAGDVGLNFAEKNPQNLIPIIARNVAAGTPVRIYGSDYSTPDGTCVRDYVHLADIVSAHVHVIEKGASGIFNLGSDSGMSVLEIVRAFGKATGKEVAYEFAPRRAGDPPMILADATKARSELGWEPVHTLDDMLTSMMRTL